MLTFITGLLWSTVGSSAGVCVGTSSDVKAAIQGVLVFGLGALAYFRRWISRHRPGAGKVATPSDFGRREGVACGFPSPSID